MPGAPNGLKMACGENPSRVYGGRNQSPATGMGNMAGYRAGFIAAREYKAKWDKWREDGEGSPPTRNLQLETLAGVLDGSILVQNHCYRADEMAQMIDLSREFGFRITAFHHAIEAYKVAPLLAREGICADMWTGWWGFKMEALDAVEANAALVDAPEGGCAVIHSDDPELTQRLNQETAAALAAGRRMGMDFARSSALGRPCASRYGSESSRIFVSTIKPGATAFTRTPCSPSSTARDCVSDTTANFDAQYAP
jgi:imidazolonepropionase-like amidohydrolase